MSADTREERLERRISDLYGSDQQFADARPVGSILCAIASRELRPPDVVQTVLAGYADRPALGQRSVQVVTDPSTGRTSAELLPPSTPSPTASCRTGSTPSRTLCHTIRYVRVIGSPSSDSLASTTRPSTWRC